MIIFIQVFSMIFEINRPGFEFERLPPLYGLNYSKAETFLPLTLLICKLAIWTAHGVVICLLVIFSISLDLDQKMY